MRERLDSIAVLGDDRRQKLLAELLRQDGHEVIEVETRETTPGLQTVQLVIFPLPALRPDGIVTAAGLTVEEIFSRLLPGTTAVGGRIPASLFALAQMHGVPLFDYLTREDFAIANALATAEAALVFALTESDRTLQGLSVLVAGAGRIGMLLARRLALLGAAVTVSARSSRDLARIAADGLRPIPTGNLAAVAGEYDLLYNTIPAPVFTREVLTAMRPAAQLIDLASAPGGVDRDAAGELGRQVRQELSLPARFSPRSAAGYVRDSVYRIWEEHP